jgi:hypothetical protein
MNMGTSCYYQLIVQKFSKVIFWSIFDQNMLFFRFDLPKIIILQVFSSPIASEHVQKQNICKLSLLLSAPQYLSGI